MDRKGWGWFRMLPASHRWGFACLCRLVSSCRGLVLVHGLGVGSWYDSTHYSRKGTVPSPCQGEGNYSSSEGNCCLSSPLLVRSQFFHAFMKVGGSLSGQHFPKCWWALSQHHLQSLDSSFIPGETCHSFQMVLVLSPSTNWNLTAMTIASIFKNKSSKPYFLSWLPYIETYLI